jgi:hypothetical protein
LTLKAGTVTALEIAGTTPVTQHDQISTTGALTLSGRLQVEFINGFLPEVGQEFQLLACGGTRQGQFVETLLPDPGAGKRLRVVYESNGVKLRVERN